MKIIFLLISNVILLLSTGVIDSVFNRKAFLIFSLLQTFFFYIGYSSILVIISFHEDVLGWEAKVRFSFGISIFDSHEKGFDYLDEAAPFIETYPQVSEQTLLNFLQSFFSFK